MQSWVELFSTSGWSPAQRVIASLAALTVMVIATLPWWWPRFRRWRDQRRIDRAIDSMGAGVLKDLSLPDEIEGQVLVDYLVLRPEGMLVVSVKRYPGLIYGGDQLNEWTQVIGGRSFKFPNPRERLRMQINAVRNLLPEVDVRGASLFTDGAEFPKDRPSGVLLIGEVLATRRERRGRGADVPGELRLAWERLSTGVTT